MPTLHGHPAPQRLFGEVFQFEADITTVTGGLICHGVNCQGKMGSGVALAIRKKWPQVAEGYFEHIKVNGTGEQNLGMVNFVKITDELHVANCFTQNFYGYDGKKYADVSAIAMSLDRAFNFAYHNDLAVYLPEIGGLRGGLNFQEEVLPTIFELSRYYHTTANVLTFRE